jgi:hypothetical protein
MPENSEQGVAGAPIAFLIPFVGKWPRWSRLFFESARRQASTHFLLVCDELPPFKLPANVRRVPSVRGVVGDIEAALGVAIGPMISGHKLCDLRPFFGIAFEEALRPYRFWGYCDVDMMLGGVESLLGAGLLDQCDVFTAHNEMCVGHFTLFRNCDRVNRLCYEIEGWHDKCKAPISRHMDENGIAAVLTRRSDIRWVRTQPLRQELQAGGRFGITFGFHGEVAYLLPAEDAVVRWHDGRVLLSTEGGGEYEALYVHFMGTKRWWHWLSYRSGREGPHYFSKIGYGGVSDPRQLRQARWRAVYAAQCQLHNIKVCGGALLRNALPHGAYLRLRRVLRRLAERASAG